MKDVLFHFAIRFTQNRHKIDFFHFIVGYESLARGLAVKSSPFFDIDFSPPGLHLDDLAGFQSIGNLKVKLNQTAFNESDP